MSQRHPLVSDELLPAPRNLCPGALLIILPYPSEDNGTHEVYDSKLFGRLVSEVKGQKTADADENVDACVKT